MQRGDSDRMIHLSWIWGLCLLGVGLSSGSLFKGGNHWIILHGTVPYYMYVVVGPTIIYQIRSDISLNYATLQYTSLNRQHYNALNQARPTLHYITLHFISYITFHFNTLPCVTLIFVMLQASSIALHFIGILHYIFKRFALRYILSQGLHLIALHRPSLHQAYITVPGQLCSPSRPLLFVEQSAIKEADGGNCNKY